MSWPLLVTGWSSWRAGMRVATHHWSRWYPGRSLEGL